MEIFRGPGGGGAGGPGPTARKQSGHRFFLSLTYFTVNGGGPMVLLQRNIYFSKDPEGVQYFPGGPTYSRGGGVQMLISIETHITCDFPGGPDPLSPLWIRT